MTDVAHVALLLALFVAVYSAIASVAGARKGNRRLMASARNGVFAVFALFSFALETMIHALLTNDFGIQLVLNNSSRDLPLSYKIAALYSDKAGSLMFWGWLISLFAVILAFQNRDRYRNIMPYALGILAAIAAFFLFLVAVVVNIFEKSSVVPADGYGLNPLLQNPGMLIHPPLLFLGYAGFAVVFAFGVASLISGEDGNNWTSGIRRWALFAWCALGIGNLAGAWWAYVELGWGGYWVWDPVENASFMPWLLGTALIHSIAIQQKRDHLRKWSIALIIFAFVFTLLSPFITHGGVTSDLHGYKGSPFPSYILAFILIVIAGSFIIVVARRRSLQGQGQTASFISREGAFLLTNIVLVSIVFLVCLGTFLPRVKEVLGENGATLDRSFFDFTAGSVLLILVFLIGFCPLLGWRRSSLASLRHNFFYPSAFALIAALILLISGIGNWYALAAVVCGFPLASIFQEWFRGSRARHRTKKESYLWVFFALIWSNRPRYGGFIVHIGIILITLGVIGSSMYDVEKTATLHEGESITLKGYTLRFDGLAERPEAKKIVTEANLSVYRGSHFIDKMKPQNNYWYRQQNNFAEAAIRTTPADDLFVSLVEYDSENQSATLRVLVNPLVVWLWIGGGVLLLGVVIAFWPQRRIPKEKAGSE